MEAIQTFCDKRLEIANCKKNLKSSMKKDEFNRIKKITEDKEEATKIV